MNYNIFNNLSYNLRFLYNISNSNVIYGYTGSHGVQIRSKQIDYPTIYQGGFHGGSV
jgi:hypothetical protein